MSDAVFNTESEVSEDSFEIGVAGEVIHVDHEITLEEVKKLGREHGLKRVFVEDSNGSTLSAEDFPYSGNISIKEYDEAK